MVEYAVNTSKFIILLLLVSALFLGIGYSLQKATVHATTAAGTTSVVTFVHKPLSVQEILHDTTLTDPTHEFAGFHTGLVIAYYASGPVVNVSPTNFRIKVNQTITVDIQKSPTTAYFLLIHETAGDTRTLTTSEALSVGDVAYVNILFDVQANKSLDSYVAIDKGAAQGLQ